MTQVKTFIIDTNREALSAGEAIRQMLNGDSVTNRDEQVPLFNNPTTGREVTYEESRKLMEWAFGEAGLNEMARYTRSLRIGGGSTAYSNSPQGRKLTAGFMGMWRLRASQDYMYARAPAIEAIGVAIGREKGKQISGRPGPVSRYAAGNCRTTQSRR